MKVKLFVDACGVDLSVKQVEENSISLLYPYINFDNKDWESDCTWRKTDKDKFFDWYKRGKFATISQPAMTIWKDEFEKTLVEGYDILFLSLSKRYCGGFKQASISKSLLSEKYPDRTFFVIDSGLTSTGYKLLALKTAELLKTENTLEDVVNIITKDYIGRLQTYWVCKNLNCVTFMSRGSDNFDINNVPKGSPLMATDFEGSFGAVGVCKDEEETYQLLLTKLGDVKEYEISYSPDYPKEEIIKISNDLEKKLGIKVGHEISWMAPTNTAIAGPYSYSVGVYR